MKKGSHLLLSLKKKKKNEKKAPLPLYNHDFYLEFIDGDDTYNARFRRPISFMAGEGSRMIIISSFLTFSSKSV